MIPAASAGAEESDWLFAALFGASLLVLLLVFGLMFLYVVRYRHDSTLDRGKVAKRTFGIEIVWTAATLVVFFGLFIWGADLFARIYRPHPDALTISVIGKQWMWKIEYPGGPHEINALHIPVNRDVQLLLTSEDVIHDFGLPGFRLKRDVLPGRYEALWLRADRLGTYHIFCDQFCGTDHASMIGSLTVMSGPDYQHWLEQSGTSTSLAAEGHELFIRFGCDGCHQNGLSGGGGAVRAPSLNGLYMSPVPLSDGSTVIADDRYIHDSILYPKEQIVASYDPVMPSFDHVIGVEDLLKIIAYVKSLAPQPVRAGGAVSMAPMRDLATVSTETESYLDDETTIWSWLLTTDHKRIALLYLASITGFFFLGGAAAALIRLNLLSPTGLIVSHEMYNRLFTMHGIVMVWFFLVPAVPVTVGNFVTPLMLGARDLAFPRLNLASWYLFVAGGLVALAGLALGGVDTGWTFYTPLSSQYAQGYIVLVCFGIILSGYSSIATGLNFIVTIHKLRAPGMGWYRLPLFLWSLYSTSVIYVLATPVLTMVMILLVCERGFGLGIFDTALGGDPLLFQHLFWFYSHPAVYIMILPGFGVISEVITVFSRKSIFGYEFIAWSSVSIAVISFFVWGHHMFVAGTSLYSSIAFSLLSFIVAVPSAIKVFNWLGTLHKGFIRFNAPMLYALGFIGLFTTGGLTGLFVASLGTDVHLHDTDFVVAHFHYIMVGAMVSAYFAGLHYWWPKITGRMYPEVWGQIAAAIIFIGFNMTFFPQFILGYEGMPRRYATYAPEFQVLNVISSCGAIALAVAYLMPMVYLTWSLFYGDRAPANPWGATGLEWQTSSPPRTENFASTPVVTEPPYHYPLPEERQHV